MTTESPTATPVTTARPTAPPSGTSTAAVPKPPAANGVARPGATGITRDQALRIVQLGLFTAGGVLMPFGIVAIGLGWYGTAHTHYAYDQTTYLISGGILGLGLTFLGGFLYFGAWLAKIGSDQRDSARQMADAMAMLTDLVARQSGNGMSPLRTESAPPGTLGTVGTAGTAGELLVLAGNGKTAHRRDCQLIAHREDLHALTGSETGLTACRVCKPALV